MNILRASNLSIQDIGHCDLSFEITCELLPPYEDLSKYSVFSTPFPKYYDFDTSEFESINANKILLVAELSGLIYGYVLASKSWNNYVQIDDLAVDKKHRKTGVGRLLVEGVIGWAKEHELMGVRIETQSVNVSACHFYKKMGFKFGGFDKYLYSAISEVKSEVALYWYYFIK